MYRKILVALDLTSADEPLLTHVAKLAGIMKSELLLLHVADGWVARNFDQLNLAGSEEMREDWRHLEETVTRLREQTGLPADARLALGSPSDQILKVADAENVDLIAMASHGHRLVGDIIHGSTIEAVRHRARVPILAVPVKHAAPGQGGARVSPP
jgi:nucleotide-binding universal stress UspA family protein